MGASKHGNVQNDKHDQRKFITFRVIGEDGKPKYLKVHLRTHDWKKARQRAAAIEHIDDPLLAKQVIAYLAASKTDAQEAARIAEYSPSTPLIPSLSFEDAEKELTNFLVECAIDPPDAEAVKRWRDASSPNSQRDVLLSLGVDTKFLADNPDIWESFRRRGKAVNPKYKDQDEARRQLFRRLLKPAALEEIFPKNRGSKQKTARGPKLSSCILAYKKTQAQKGTTQKHNNACISKFQAFIDSVGDKAIASLEKGDFVRFKDKILTEKKGKSNKTINDCFKPIGAILRIARTDMDDGTFPDALDHWLSVWESNYKPYKPPVSNRQPMPVSVFQSLLAKADVWAAIVPENFSKTMPINKEKPHLSISNNLRESQRMQRDGLLGHVGLCLAVNCGALAIDFARLKWSDLSTDLKYFRQPRTKTETNEDMIIPVCCPLLPETSRSLRRWKKIQDAMGGSEYVFTNLDLTTFESEEASKVSEMFGNIRKAAGCDKWKIRHCRNVGETLRKNEGLPTDMGTAWLRHSEGGTNVFYQGKVDDDYLSPLVNVIGRTYFPVTDTR